MSIDSTDPDASSPARARSVAILGTRGYPSYYGGFETLVRRLAPFLAERGWDVRAYSRPGAVRADDPARDDRVRVVTTRGLETKSVSTLTFGLTSAAHASREGADVALVMNVANGYWLPFLRARRMPIVLNVDGIEWEREKWGRLARLVFRGGARMTAWLATTLVYDAAAIRDRWRERYGRDGVVIAYGGARPGELAVPEGLVHRGYTLVVARFVPENTIPEFFDAVPELAAVGDVVIVGSSGYGGDLDERAAALARDNPRVRWLGHVSDDDLLFALWQHAGAYFHGHSVGGTNPALVQAMACGAPVVARDTVFNREVLGDVGIFTSPEPAAIAATVSALLADPERADAMGRAAESRAAEHYDWDDVCAAYERALLEAIGDR